MANQAFNVTYEATLVVIYDRTKREDSDSVAMIRMMTKHENDTQQGGAHTRTRKTTITKTTTTKTRADKGKQL